MTVSRTIAAAALTLLCAQPCLAAEDMRFTGAAGEKRSGAFAGVTVRMGIGTRLAERPTARLQLTTFHDYRDTRGASTGSYRPRGLELGFDGGRPTYLVGGRDMRQVRERLNASGSTKTWLLVGGALVLTVVVLAAVAGAQPTPGPDDDAF